MVQEVARSEADDEDMGEAPTLEGLQAQAEGKQAEYASRQKRARKEDLTPAQAQGARLPQFLLSAYLSDGCMLTRHLVLLQIQHPGAVHA